MTIFSIIQRGELLQLIKICGGFFKKHSIGVEGWPCICSVAQHELYDFTN